MVSFGGSRYLVGQCVVGSDRRRLGIIVGFHTSAATKKTEWIAINTRSFIPRVSLAPFEGCHVDGSNIVTPWTRRVLERAPKVDKQEDGTLSLDCRQQLFEYYGL